ncbi:hypothetical protein [Capillimicrobium parvum]|uniref:Uncharacterized protein n=1 Tax=Capillimicrobium parvum TaxID=2884022 RepID=A0A9E6XZH0_9ACTN|nr:hypothetical protein [Capillimicrobium parvum]UGS37329.1 hypothetical protein DSM104329_03744 [Capillimicrobium parvum]
MALLITVHIAADIGTVERVEAEHPEVMKVIGAAAARYMTAHRRTHRDGEVLDLDEFASPETLAAFREEAEEAIARYGELIGARPEETVYEVQGE